MNLLYPSTIVGGIGLLTMAFYVKQVDDAYNRTLSKFNKVHNNTDYRLHALEQAINNRGNEQKKLDWTTKNLCKWANLFNNPTYEICNTGYESGHVRE